MIEIAVVAVIGAALAWLQARNVPEQSGLPMTMWARWESELHDWQLD